MATRKTMQEIYKDAKPIGMWPAIGHGTLLVFKIMSDIEDFAIAGYEENGVRSKIKYHKIGYTRRGNGYIKKDNMRYYFFDIKKLA